MIDDVWQSPVSFSPGGKRFAFVREHPKEQYGAMMIADADGNNERQVAMRKVPDHFGRVAWSPDGKLIACVVQTTDAAGYFENVIGIATDGGRLVPISSQRWTMVSHISWLADMTALVITARDQIGSLPLKIWWISFPEGSARRITNDFSG